MSGWALRLGPTAASPRTTATAALCLVTLISMVSVRALQPAPGQRPPAQPSVAVPAHEMDVVLGRPTATSVAVSVLFTRDANASVAYGLAPDRLTSHTGVVKCSGNEPQVFSLTGLKPDTGYHYQVIDGDTGKAALDGVFHTQRPAGRSFTFTITADSHLDGNTDVALYQRTLTQALADSPDFHVDLGDTFMTEKHASRAAALDQYLAQRYYLGRLARSVPLFLVQGNHDGEDGRSRRGGSDSLADWANATRKSLFPNPVPDSFYSGDATAAPREDHAAWMWGDALFITLEPFWNGSMRREDGAWGLTLGDAQYQWLKRTLEGSKARYKFVFIHNLAGGLSSQGRGGAEAVPYGEWGGKNDDGTDGFAEHRPGWAMPVHSLLVRNHVTAVFHGHDHLYAQQAVDGIVYQAVPQPGDPRGNTNAAAAYGYRGGSILPSSGYLRVTLATKGVKVEYVRSSGPSPEVARAYTISPSGSLDAPATGTSAAPAPADLEPAGPAPADRPQRRGGGGRGGNRPGGGGGGGNRPRGGGGGGGATDVALPATVQERTRLSAVLARPTDTSVTLNVLSSEARRGYCEFGPKSGQYAHHTPTIDLPAGQPVEIVLDGLSPSSACYYRLRSRKSGDAAFETGTERSFHTRRAAGVSFRFEMQGDSHPERRQQFDPALYAQALSAAAEDRPDFYICLGDDFSVDTLRAVNASAVRERYLYQRPFLSLVADAAPLFLVNGNHEQASRANLDGTAENVAAWAQTARNSLFPQPAPDEFYTGDAEKVPFIGALRDYYAWTWGDALFVVIDPYWHSPKVVDNPLGSRDKAARDLWDVTLGSGQYNWLRKTLEASKAKYKFVFSHHVLGTGRGGIEEAGLCEWGGKDRRGDDQFTARRPGWEMPIQALMAKSGVTIFFQGHDHIFAHQALDGVVYQTLPEPADPNYALYNDAAFTSGDKLPNSGRLRVSVSPEKVTVEYVRSWLPKDVPDGHKDGEVAFTYSVPAKAAR